MIYKQVIVLGAPSEMVMVRFVMVKVCGEALFFWRAAQFLVLGNPLTIQTTCYRANTSSRP